MLLLSVYTTWQPATYLRRALHPLGQVYHFSCLEKKKFLLFPRRSALIHSCICLFFFFFSSLCGNWRLSVRHRPTNILFPRPASSTQAFHLLLRLALCLIQYRECRFLDLLAKHLKIASFFAFFFLSFFSLAFRERFHAVLGRWWSCSSQKPEYRAKNRSQILKLAPKITAIILSRLFINLNCYLRVGLYCLP